MYSQGVELSQCEKVVSPVKGVDFAIRVSGDSMEPEIMNGSILYIKRINDRGIIPWGHPVVIDTENGVLVKMIDPSGDSDPYDDSDGTIEAKELQREIPAAANPEVNHLRTLPHRGPGEARQLHLTRFSRQNFCAILSAMSRRAVQ